MFPLLFASIAVAIPVSVLLPISGCAAEDTLGRPCTLSEPIQYPSGALHSVPCTSDAECLYGRCRLTPAVADFSFCTKRCDCGTNSACTDDDGAGQTYVCQRFDPRQWPDEPIAVCTQTCETLADCPDGYTRCAPLTGSASVCLTQ